MGRGSVTKAILVLLSIFFIQLDAEAVVQCTNEVRFSKEVAVRVGPNTSHRLYLNGVGRKRVLGINIFYAALYLQRPSSNAIAILNSNQTKLGIIHTTRNISRRQIVQMWNQEFDRLCGSDCEALRPFHNRFISYARDVQRNERLYLIILPDRFEFVVNNNEIYDPIYSPEYADLMQRVLIGPDAEDKSMEDGLLGKTQICR
jgi:hypothetical protein